VPTLVVKDGPRAGSRVEVEEELVLGRTDQDFLQHDSEVSRRHAAVRPAPTGLEIEDLGSSNGTFVNDSRIEGVTTLSSGDEVRLGQTTLQVEIEAGATPTLVREMVSPTRAAPTPAPPPEAPPVQPPAPPEPPPEPPTLPQPPVLPSAEAPEYGPPGPPASEPPAPPQPPGYGPAGVAAGYRPGIVTTSAILLLLGGLAAAGYGIYAFVVTLQDFRAASSIGLGTAFTLIMVFAGLMAVAGGLQVVGGFRTLALSRAGRILGFVGSGLVIVAWIGILGVLFANDFRPNGIGWLALGLSVPLAVASVAVLGASGRYLTA
jgi:FHA domain